MVQQVPFKKINARIRYFADEPKASVAGSPAILLGDDVATEFFWSVEGVSAATPNGVWLTAELVAAAPEADGMLMPAIGEPGDGPLYTLDFPISGEDFNGGLYAITIKFEQFGVPSTISTSSIAMEATEPGPDNDIDAEDDNVSYTFNPATVTVDGKEVIITIPDVSPEDQTTKKTFVENSKLKVLVYQSAGITNPTEANTYGGASPHTDREIFATFGDSGVARVNFSAMTVPRLVEIDPEDGGSGRNRYCHR